MGAKQKGTAGERQLVKLFWDTGSWSAHRIAGSGSSRYPSPDVIAGNKLRTLAIEAKVTSSTRKYFEDAELQGLTDFCDLFAAEPWIAIRFPKTDWLFFSLDDLEKSGKHNVMSLKRGRMIGVGFEELIRE